MIIDFVNECKHMHHFSLLHHTKISSAPTPSEPLKASADARLPACTTAAAPPRLLTRVLDGVAPLPLPPLLVREPVDSVVPSVPVAPLPSGPAPVPVPVPVPVLVPVPLPVPVPEPGPEPELGPEPEPEVGFEPGE